MNYASSFHTTTFVTKQCRARRWSFVELVVSKIACHSEVDSEIPPCLIQELQENQEISFFLTCSVKQIGVKPIFFHTWFKDPVNFRKLQDTSKFSSLLAKFPLKLVSRFKFLTTTKLVYRRVCASFHQPILHIQIPSRFLKSDRNLIMSFTSYARNYSFRELY